ncbi:MAG: type II secretion system protein GspC [Thermodesulfobacteriota bacterium]
MFATILKRYVWVVNLILLAVLAYLLALSVNGKIQSKVTSQNAEASQKFFPSENNETRRSNKIIPISSYQIILKRNIFSVSETDSSEKLEANPDTLPESNLNLILLGTIINPDAKSVAIIKNDDNSKVNGYRGGESIDIIESETVKLLNVEHCKAVIQRKGKGPETIKCKNLGDVASAGGDNKRLRLKKSPAASDTNRRPGSKKSEKINKIGENKYEVSRDLLENLLSDPSKIIQQARVIPQDDGLRFFGIRSNSIFWKIGIKNGDTLHSINNVELNNLEKALTVFEELRYQNSFTIDLTRAGQKYTYEYTVK